jgi:proline dehydrogenase
MNCIRNRSKQLCNDLIRFRSWQENGVSCRGFVSGKGSGVPRHSVSAFCLSSVIPMSGPMVSLHCTVRGPYAMTYPKTYPAVYTMMHVSSSLAEALEEEEGVSPAPMDPSFARSPSPSVCIDTHEEIQKKYLEGEQALPLDFDDPKAAFESKTTWEIMRSLLVFRICKMSWLVKKADTILKWSKRLFTPYLVNFVVKNTFYGQFVAGSNAETIQPVMKHLERNGIHSVLDYAAEDDVNEETGVAQSRALGGISSAEELRTSTVVVRTYRYEDEEACDRRMEHFLESIRAAGSVDRQGFAAIKVTALGNPKLLERVSNALLAVRDLFRVLDENGDGFVDKDEFTTVCSRLFNSSGGALKGVFDRLDTDKDGKVDYIAFTKGITVYRGTEIASRCKEQGPFSRAALSDEELELLNAMLGRVNTLTEAAVESGVRIMIDAEHSYFQPAIDSVVTELQRRFNRNEPRVYNTYQCYLKDAHDRILVELERSRREGYKFGCKLVRGAYMVLERERALEKGYPSPVWDTKEETHACYDGAVAMLLPWVKNHGAEFMVASHNQASVELTVAGMKAHGLQPQDPVYFGQLLGMADNLTYTLGAHGYGAYKYVPFGSIDEVMPYLIRRAQENSDVLGGIAKETTMLRSELKRRLLPFS